MPSRRTIAQANGSERPASTPEVNIENGVLEQLLPANWRELVGPDPHRPGPDRGRLLAESIPVWALIGHLRAVGPEITRESSERTADDYLISIGAVAAAVAHYLEHREAIDTRLAINAAAVA